MSHSRKISPKIWFDALYGIPRLNADQWNTLDLFGRWLVAIRAAVLLMTAFATFISGIFAYQHDKFDVFRLGKKMSLDVSVNDAEEHKIDRFLQIAGAVFHEVTPNLRLQYVGALEGV